MEVDYVLKKVEYCFNHRSSVIQAEADKSRRVEPSISKK